MGSTVKEEIPDHFHPARPPATANTTTTPTVIDLSSGESDDSDAGEENHHNRSKNPNGVAKRSRDSNQEQDKEQEEAGTSKKKKGARDSSDSLPIGFLDPLPLPPPDEAPAAAVPVFKQFWKAGDYDGSPGVITNHSSVAGFDHVRVHPKFLHSNATSHKWALGALAELLDNSLDEVSNGATYVNIDMLNNKKDGSRMLLVEDNGGGMDPDKMRQCMSLGYSAKCKMASTIGQYGNGFKTSTMRLGADVIVFSRSRGKDSRRPTESIGMLSYTFLRSTGKEDIVVPMVDYEKDQTWKKLTRTNSADWKTNLDTIIKWSPYSSETDLLNQFSMMKDQGTRIVIYNLWEDEQGQLELDFDADPHDIQIRGVNRDEKNIEMAGRYPNSKHFLTYRHSLRSYASILYLRLPHVFRMILRGKEIEHHNIVNDMMFKQEVTYRPQTADGVTKDPNMIAVVTIGFIKDGKDHIDVQGFNVYHKNRLIKPFWRVWTAAGSGGRCVIGVLEANFIEPAHDKQDFERTTILSRLEGRLIQMQKNYWNNNSHRIGYCGNAQNRNKKDTVLDHRETSPEATPPQPTARKPGKAITRKSVLGVSPQKSGGENSGIRSASLSTGLNNVQKAERTKRALDSTTSSKLRRLADRDGSDSSDDNDPEYFGKFANRSSARVLSQRGSNQALSPGGKQAGNGVVVGGDKQMGSRSLFKEGKTKSVENGLMHEDSESIIKQLKTENEELKEKMYNMELKMAQELQCERDNNRKLTEELEEARKKVEEASKEQEALIDIFSEERSRRDKDEENLRKKLKEASATIQELTNKLSAARNNKC